MNVTFKTLEDNGWTDISWGNDAMPSLTLTDGEDEPVWKIWVDYDDLSDREDPEAKQFTITLHGEELFATDEPALILEYAKAIASSPTTMKYAIVRRTKHILRALENASLERLRDFSIDVSCHLEEALYKAKFHDNASRQLDRARRLTSINNHVLAEMRSRLHDLSLEARDV